MILKDLLVQVFAEVKTRILNHLVQEGFDPCNQAFCLNQDTHQANDLDTERFSYMAACFFVNRQIASGKLERQGNSLRFSTIKGCL